MPTLLSKSKLVAFRLCPKRLWLAVNRPSLREVSDATARNFDAGHQVGAVARRVYDARERGTLVDIDDLGFAGALRRSRALLGAKSPQPVFEAGFAAAGVLAFADVMLPATRPRSGMPPERSTSWRMIEVKSTTTLKDYHRDDVAIQTFAALQSGIELSAVAVAHLNKGSVYPGDRNYGGLFCEVDLTAEVMTRQAEVAEWVDDAHRFSQRQREPRQAMGAQCAEPFECAYRAHCEARTPPVKAAKYPVIWLPQVRTTALKERIAALSAQARAPDMRHIDDSLLSTEQLRVKTATLAGKVAFDRRKSRAALAPHGEAPTFLDFETIAFAVPRWAGTTPWQQVPFQFAAHRVEADGTLSEHGHLDLTGNDPRPGLVRALVHTFGGTHRARPVFAYNAGFERTCLEQLAAAVPRHRRELLDIAARLVDLLPVTRAHYYHPAQCGSWSIKQVLPTIAPDLDYQALDGVQHGQAAQDVYLEAIAAETSEQRRTQIDAQLRDYCALDSYAMVVLWAKLAGRAVPAAPSAMSAE